MNLTLKEARAKLGAKQEELGKVFAEATVTTDSGQKGYDFSLVTCLGDQVKGSGAVADHVKAANAELEALAVHAETLEAAEKAAAQYADREKSRNRPRFAGGDGSKGGQSYVGAKSLGDLVSGEKAYQDWAAKGAVGDLTLSLEDVWASDMLAKGMAFDTLGSKALMSTAEGYAPEVTRAAGFVEMVTRPLQVLDLIPMFRTDQAAYSYMEETTRTHAAAERAEGAAFAESTFAFTEKSSPVRKITDSVPVTDEQLADVREMTGYINSRLSFGVYQRADLQSVVGDGTAPNWRGLKNVPGIQTEAMGLNPAMDAFYRAMTKIRLNGRAIPTHHLMHPNDWQDIRLTRTVDGIYILGNPSDAGPERLWGLPVVQQDADVEGRGYTGSFQPTNVSMHERQGVEIEIGFVGSQFIEGKRTVRASIRAALVWRRPPAFCSVTGI